MKNLLVILLLTSSSCIYSQNKESFIIKFDFYIKNKIESGSKIYFIKSDGNAYLLPQKDDKVIINNIAGNSIPLILVNGKHKIVFPLFYFDKAKHVKIYYDARIFGNKTKKNLGISSWKYLFKKEYYVNIDEFDDIITVFKSPKKYKLID